MAVTLQARNLTLELLRQQFNLRATTTSEFFPEWMALPTNLTTAEQERLDQVKTHFLHLSQAFPLMEDATKMVIVSPLLDLAGFDDDPFHFRTEASTEVSALDGETLIRGQIDVLVTLNDLWIVVIEAKNMGIGLSVGIPQALGYMLAHPEAERPSYGLVTNGSEFVFLKLRHRPTPQYATSRVFSMLSPVNELYDVLKIFKALGNIIRP